MVQHIIKAYSEVFFIMDISQIDKNFSVCTEIPEDVEWHSIREDGFTLYGLLDKGDDGFRRLPDEITKEISEELYLLSRCTAGGRLRFKTDSHYVAIRVSFSQANISSHMAFINAGGFDFYENTEFASTFRGSYRPPSTPAPTYTFSHWAGLGMKDLTLNFPCYGAPIFLEIGLKKGSRLEKTDGYRDCAPIVFYGSSITQGGCASRPGLSYENFVSRRFNVDYYNFGFSGNGKGEESVVRYMAGLPMSAFVSDYDHNAPSFEHLEETHYRMYEIIREAHPDIPYFMISKPDFDNDPNGAPRRRDIIYHSWLGARENGDKNVYFIDGKRIFQGEDRADCTVDGCHPNDLGMYRFANTLIGEFTRILK